MSELVGRIVGVEAPNRKGGSGTDGGLLLDKGKHGVQVAKMKYRTALELLNKLKGRTVRISTRALVVTDMKGNILYSSTKGGSK